jgi:hypothetical protein
MRKFLPPLLCLILIGCKSLGLAQPQGFDQQLANAYGVHTAVVQATATALTAGSITPADAVAVQSMEKNARSLLDSAKAVEQVNPAGAQQNLTLALSALTALQTYLNTHGK